MVLMVCFSHSGGWIFTQKYTEKDLLNLFKNPFARKFVTCLEAPSGCVDLSLLKSYSLGIELGKTSRSS